MTEIAAAARPIAPDAAPGPFLHPFAKPAATDFTTMVRGQGAVVWDEAGRRYVDAMGSLWYCNIGRGRPEMAEAIGSQAGRLAGYHCFDRFTNAPADALAARIAELAPEPASRIFFTSGGSEAVDTALKIVRLAHALRGEPQRTLVISRRPSYHGVTYGGMSLTGLPLNSEHFGPGVGAVVQVPKDDLEAVQRVLTEHPGQVAAVFAEPVIGAGGVFPPAAGYLEGLRALCDEHGAFLVLDEVISAFGRLGHWFGTQRYGVRADLITFAKAITSGYVPLGGVILAPAVHEALAADPDFLLRHGYTYSGHPLACAAGLACLDIIEKEGLIERGREIGARLATGLRGLLADGLVSEVRGETAIWAVAVPEAIGAVTVRDRLLDHGVIVRPMPPTTVAMCPPLVIEPDDVDAIIAGLRAVLTA